MITLMQYTSAEKKRERKFNFSLAVALIPMNFFHPV